MSTTDPTQRVTKRELDALRCPTEGCDCHMRAISARCCNTDALVVIYDQLTGLLALMCHECGKLLAHVAVADDAAPRTH